MKRLMIAAFANVVVVAAAVIILRSPSTSIDIAATPAAMPPLHKLHAAVGVNKLPAQEVDDQSLVYPPRIKP